MATDLEALRAEITRELAEARIALLRLLDTLRAEDWQRASPNPGWTVREVVAHVAAGETTVQPLLRRLAAGQGGVPDDFDLDRYNASQVRRRTERSMTELLAELETARSQTLQVLEGTSEQALARRGRHPRGVQVSLAEALRIIALHDREHAEDIRRAVAKA